MLEMKYVYVVVIDYQYDNGAAGTEVYAYDDFKKAENRVKNELELIKNDYSKELK